MTTQTTRPPGPPHAAGARRVTRRTVLAALGLGAAGAGVGTVVATRGGGADEPAADVTVFGAAASFGRLARVTRLAGGRSVRTVGVEGFAFGPGQAAYMTVVAPDGTVLMGTTPLTDNQVQPTGTDLELGVFEPRRRRFTRLVVPSSTGITRLPSANPRLRGAGGGDVADFEVLPSSDGTLRMAFVVTSPYQGWDVRTDGLLPTYGRLARKLGGRWRYDRSASRTTDQLAAGAADQAAAAVAFPAGTDGAPRSNRGTTDIARLPHSGHLVVVQYFGSSAQGQGALLVIDQGGTVRATWAYPPTSVAGQPVVVHPREVNADPSSAADDERFVVIADSNDPGGGTVPFTVQEFAYQASTRRVVPRSTAVRAAQDGSRMETAAFGPDGTLYVARTRADGLSADRLAVYPRAGPTGERGLVTRTPAGPDWAAASWGTTCVPDQLVEGSTGGGLVRSLVVDPKTGAALLTGDGGLVQAVTSTGSGTARRWRVAASLDIGLSLLRDSSRRYVGVRRGGVDADRRLLWIPLNQLVLDSRTWPYPPFPVQQWLCRVDLARLLPA